MRRSVAHTVRAAALVAGAAGLARADEDPLAISVRTAGRFARGHSWHLSANSAGQAELTVYDFESPHPTRKQFQVPKEQWAGFRKAPADGGSST